MTARTRRVSLLPFRPVHIESPTSIAPPPAMAAPFLVAAAAVQAVGWFGVKRILSPEPGSLEY